MHSAPNAVQSFKPGEYRHAKGHVLSALVSVINLFGAHWYPEFIHNVANGISDFVNLVKTVLFLGLAFKALSQGDIPVPAVDRFIKKYI